MLRKNNDFNSSLDCLQSENDLLKSKAAMPINFYIILNDNLDKDGDKIALLKSNASLPCGSCDSLIDEINELKMTHTTYVDQLEHSRAEICKMKFMPSSMSSLVLNHDTCLTSYDNHDILRDVNDDACSRDLICASCIQLKNEVLALKQMRDDMNAKMVEHNKISANLEKENDLLHTTYA